MLCEKILGTTHHGSYKKVIDVLFTKDELTLRSNRKIARDGIEIELDISEDLQEGDIIAENENYVYAVKIFVPKKEADTPWEASAPKTYFSAKSYLDSSDS